MATRIPARYHRIDGWRGYSIPGTAIIGSSYTGEFEDSPAPGALVAQEIRRFRKEVLIPAGIKSRTRWGNSSNLFCSKCWICVSPDDFYRAAALADKWLTENDRNLHYLHDAALGEVLTQDQQQVVQS